MSARAQMRNRSRRPPNRLILIVLGAVILAACGGRGEEGSGAGTAAGNGPKRPVIGAVLMQQDQFFRLNESGMEDAAERLTVDLKLQNAGGALDKEVSILDTFMTQKVDAVLVS